ncbi:MAG: M1 family metallopeptidase [Bacteroidota bacterium]
MWSFFIREIPIYRNFLFLVFTFILVNDPSKYTVAQEKTVTWYADPSAIPPDLPIKINHLTAHVSFKPTENIIEGTAEFTFTWNRPAKDPIIFHAPDFKVSSVKIDQKEVKFQLSNSQLLIYPDSLVPRPSSLVPRPSSLVPRPSSLVPRPSSLVKITYSAAPLAGNPYFIGWRPEEAGKRKQIWAHRPNGWLPYIDGRITVDLFVTFDKNYKVFSNGERLEVKNNPDETKTWHYAMKKDHPFFSTSLVIGDYDYKSGKTSRGVPLEFWYYPDMPDRVGTTYMFTERMFDFLEAELGFNYPYPLYREAPVSDYMYGAMETTTSTVFGDYMQITPRSWWQRNYVNVNVHELAHQWFGNCVAHFVNRDVWLTESFGTYYAKLFEKKMFGDDYWQNIRNDEMLLTFEAAKKNNFPVGGSQGGNQRIYQKGSLALEMLRNVMGDRAFRDAVNLYLNKYAFGYAETNDFIRCTYEATGKPWNWFFDQWILRGGEPDYFVSDSIFTDSSKNLSTVFKVRQMQPVTELSGLFKMPVTFEVHYTDGSYDSLTTWIEKAETDVAISNPQKKKVEFLLFDPGRKILKKVTFRQPKERLMAQALKAGTMIDRYDALKSLRDEPLKNKMNLLTTSFQKEKFHLIRTEALKQIGSDTSSESLQIFRNALEDRDALVRKAALIALNPVPGSLRKQVETLLYDSSYLNVEYALGALCISFPESIPHYLDLAKDMEGWRGKNIRMLWLYFALADGRKEYLPELISYCSPKYEFETRMNAFNLLKNMKYSNPETLKYAEEAAKHWNNKLSAVATEYLKVAR